MKDAAPAERTKEAFFDHVYAELRGDLSIDAEAAVREVFGLLARKISPGEIEDVKNILPPEVRALWPDAAAD